MASHIIAVFSNGFSYSSMTFLQKSKMSVNYHV